jgi:hypothetical protein
METKIAIINETKNENVTSFAGVPSWMLVLMNKMLEETGKEIYLTFGPILKCTHGGVNFEPYREQYKKYCQKRF